jgi:putative ABC transport system substrate-binding protein
MQKLGWTEGRNIQIETRWTMTGLETIQRLAQELVALQPDLLLSSSAATTRALLQQTRAIPIVFATVADPVGSGFVASLSRPGGNVTGITGLDAAMAGKWLELLTEMAPRLNRAGFLFEPATGPFAENFVNAFKAAAASRGIEAIVSPTADAAAIEALARVPNAGFVVMPGLLMARRRAELIALAARHRLPALYPFRYYAELGGLLSLSVDAVDNYRRAAACADRILRGEKPGELPVQSPVAFELTINRKTASALGLDIPPSLQARASAVLQ